MSGVVGGGVRLRHRLVFDVYNPNAYRLRATRIEIGLDLEGGG